MTDVSERLAPREGLEQRLAEALAQDLSNPPEVIRLVLDAIDSEGFSIVPDEWVPNAGLFDEAAERLDAVRALMAGTDQSHADVARNKMRALSDLACAVLGLPPREERV